MFYIRKQECFRFIMLSAFIISAWALLLCPAAPCTAATVSNTNNSGAGSLRQAIIDTASGDVIDFTGLTGNTITLSSQLEISSKDITIEGPGKDVLSISGGGSCRVFNIHNCSADISGLSIVSGDDTGNGGGIYLEGSSGPAHLTLEHCSLKNNVASFGGAIYNNSSSADIVSCDFSQNTTIYGGAIYNDHSSADIVSCDFSGNSANYYGGAVYNSDGTTDITNCDFSQNTAASYSGGAIYNNSSSAGIVSCDFSDNKAQDGGAIYNESTSCAGFTNCTFSGNTAVGKGGAFSNKNSSADVANCIFDANTASSDAGAICNDHTSCAGFTNCTFSGNTAVGKGGVFLNANSSADVANCTFSDNNASHGSGFATSDLPYMTSSDVDIANCIFWDKGSSEIYTDAGSAKPVMEYCVVSGDITSADVSGDLSSIIHGDPLLGALADNGGLTETCALGDGSSAIDAGKTIATVSTDQRGVSRPQGGAYDIGAYEKVPGSSGDDADTESDTDKNTGGGDSGCSLGCTGPSGLLLLAPLAMLILKR